jgi:hypothetical protein
MRVRELAGSTLIAMVVVVLMAGPSHARASVSDDADQIILSGRLVVPDGETVDTAVLFHGSAIVDGHVTDSLTVFDGDTEISGSVDGDVVVFNGSVTVRSGAVIGGDLVTTETPTVEQGATIRGDQQRMAGRFRWSDIGFASRIAWWIGYSVSTLVLGLLLLLIAPGLDGAIARTWRQRTGAAVGLGAATFFLLPVVAVLFLVTIVAIPLGIFLLLALGLLYTLGYVAGAHVVGRAILKEPTSRFLAFLLGWGIVRIVGSIPVLGGLTWLGAAIVGLGTLWVAARPRAALAAPPAPPPAPVESPTGPGP